MICSECSINVQNVQNVQSNVQNVQNVQSNVQNVWNVRALDLFGVHRFEMFKNDL